MMTWTHNNEYQFKDIRCKRKQKSWSKNFDIEIVLQINYVIVIIIFKIYFVLMN